MAVEDLGRKLLGDCVEATLGEVLRSLRADCNALDDEKHDDFLFDQFLGDKHNHPQGRQQRLPVLEICSDKTGAGKTQLIYYIIANAVLPDIHGESILDGKNGIVVLLDTESHFNITRLVQIISTYIESKSIDEAPVNNTTELIERTLQQLHIFQPTNMSSLLDTLNGLQDYLLNSSTHFSQPRAVHSIIIDSASAFYWETRAALDDEKLAALDAKAPSASAIAMPPPKPNPYALLVNRLRALQHKFNCAVIATSTMSRYSDPATGEQTIRTLPAPWPNFPTSKLVVRRDDVKRFTLGISWEDADRDKKLRQEAVDKGYFSVSELDGGEAFRVAITKDGVSIVKAKKEEEGDEETMVESEN